MLGVFEDSKPDPPNVREDRIPKLFAIQKILGWAIANFCVFGVHAKILDVAWSRRSIWAGIGTCCPLARPNAYRFGLDFGLAVVLTADLCWISGNLVCAWAICVSVVVLF